MITDAENLLSLNDAFDVKLSPGKGYGVFAKERLNKDDVFFLPYTKILRAGLDDNSPLTVYAFPINRKYKAIMGEFGCFINHSKDPNVVIEYSLPDIGDFQKFRIIKDISLGEELFLNYGKWAEEKFGE